MIPGRGTDGRAAVRALYAASQEIENLRRGADVPPEEARGLVLRVANAVDRSLRRMLRDDETANLTLRLSALAPDELRSDAVLSELRRTDRLPVELAAGIHELLDARRRLEGGAVPTEADRARAVRVADLLGVEIQRASTAGAAVGSSSAPAYHAPQAEEVLADPTVVSLRRRRRGSSGWLGAFLVVVLLAAAAAWFVQSRGSNEMEQGVALFEAGAFADAAQYFFRYAQANPDDVTPQLYLARIHRRMNRPDLATAAIREAERIAPDDAAVHRELGFLLLDTGSPDVAVSRFRTAIQLDEESSEGWVGLVRALRESDQDAEANAVIADAPAEVRALLTRTDTL